MTKIPTDVSRTFPKPRDMYCLYGEWCNEKCGHKVDHKENTACHNMCVVYGEITCREKKVMLKDRWINFWLNVWTKLSDLFL